MTFRRLGSSSRKLNSRVAENSAMKSTTSWQSSGVNPSNPCAASCRSITRTSSLLADSSNWSTRLSTAPKAWFWRGKVFTAKMILPSKRKDEGTFSWLLL